MEVATIIRTESPGQFLKILRRTRDRFFFFSFLHLRRVKLEEEKNQKKGSVKINHVFRKSKGLNGLEGQVS